MLPQCQALMMIMRRAILIVDDDIGMMSTAAQYSHLGRTLCHGIPPLCSSTPFAITLFGLSSMMSSLVVTCHL